RTSAQHPDVLGNRSSLLGWTNAVLLSHPRSVEVHVEQSRRKGAQCRTCQPAWNFWKQLQRANTNFCDGDKPTERFWRHVSQDWHPVGRHFLKAFGFLGGQV